jgi:hypothetical protein
MKIIILIFTIVIFACSYAKSQLPFKVITVHGEILATKANIFLEPAIEVQSNEIFELKR